MEIAIISDTHMPRRARVLPADCLERLAGADLIVHAGDFQAASVLGEIESIGPPVRAVHGNVDSAELRRRLPEEAVLDLDGLPLALVHDAGPAQGRLERMRARFPEAGAVVFGHSHMPLHEERDGFQIFNPGSPTDRRRAPGHTMGIARAEHGRVAFELVPVGG